MYKRVLCIKNRVLFISLLFFLSLMFLVRLSLSASDVKADTVYSIGSSPIQVVFDNNNGLSSIYNLPGLGNGVSFKGAKTRAPIKKLW